MTRGATIGPVTSSLSNRRQRISIHSALMANYDFRSDPLPSQADSRDINGPSSQRTIRRVRTPQIPSIRIHLRNQKSPQSLKSLLSGLTKTVSSQLFTGYPRNVWASRMMLRLTNFTLRRLYLTAPSLIRYWGRRASVWMPYGA